MAIRLNENKELVERIKQGLKAKAECTVRFLSFLDSVAKTAENSFVV